MEGFCNNAAKMARMGARNGLAPDYLPLVLMIWAVHVGWAAGPMNKETYTQFSESGQIVTEKYLDGLGRLRQTHVKSGDLDLISGIEYDEVGRPVRMVKTFPGPQNSHDYYSGSLSGAANAYYDGQSGKPDAGGFAFSETEFDKDPYSGAHRIGAVGEDFAIDHGNETVYWRFGRNSDAFLGTNQLTVAYLDGLTDDVAGQYILIVVRDQNGNFTQVIKNKFGQTIKVWGDPKTGSATSGKSITGYQFDAFGNAIKTTPYDADGNPAYNRSVSLNYSTTGQLLLTDQPDAGVRRNVYDRSGRLRFVEDSRQAALGQTLTNYFTAMKYDRMGRVVQLGVFWSGDDANYFTKDYADDPSFPAGSGYHPKIQHYYDDVSGMAAEFGIPTAVTGDIKNAKGNVVGSVTYDESGLVGAEHRVVEAFSHDEYGRIVTRYKWIPTLPMQKIEYSYRLNGQPASVKTPLGRMEYHYDALDRLSDVYVNGIKSISYSYDAFDRVASKDFYDASGSTKIGTTSYLRDLRNQVYDINHVTQGGQSLYRETLERESALNPRYDGSIGAVQHDYPSLGFNRKLSFSYDGLNRITSAEDDGTGNVDYEEAFSYDVFGRMDKKRKGAPDLIGFSPQYQYDVDGSRLKFISNSPSRDKTPNGFDNYAYDPNGNLVLDRSQKMVVVYDWRNHPVSYKFYDVIPDKDLDWMNLEALDYSGEARLAYRIESVYDVSGHRVLKRKVEN
jgi:YD repeat-containing protein